MLLFHVNGAATLTASSAISAPIMEEPLSDAAFPAVLSPPARECMLLSLVRRGPRCRPWEVAADPQWQKAS
eukprot:6260167-Pyramimonas_sp.AAC.1